MIRYPRRYWLLASCLAMTAGFVDALAFIHLRGFFVSFMSGNSTRLGVGLATSAAQAMTALALICAFVAGVMTGALVGRRVENGVAPRVLFAVTLVLVAAGVSAALGNTWIAVLLLAVAMGAANAVFQRDGEVAVGVTYMTGTLVKFGQRLATALTGGPRFGWVAYLMLWAALVLGACAGAFAYARFGLGGIWIAAVVMTVLSISAPKLSPLTP